MAMLQMFCLFLLVCSFVTQTINSDVTWSRKSSAELWFLVMGDWGGLPDDPYTTPIEVGTSKEMKHIAEQYNTDFVIALGDNFYFDGVTSVHDARFQETYERVFTGKSLSRPWYVIAGNHDHRGNVSAQIEYSRYSGRWNYPDYYYKLEASVPNSNHKIDFIMIDTVVLCGNTDDRAGAQPHGPGNEQHAEKHWQWIEQQLHDSKSEYLVVSGHYPVYSVAEHGPTHCLISRLEPLLHKYRVTAYFSGHDHNLQHLQYNSMNHTVQYFVSGSANFIDTSMVHKSSVPPGSLVFHWAEVDKLGGFALVRADDAAMTFIFIESDGTLLHKHTMYPRKL